MNTKDILTKVILEPERSFFWNLTCPDWFCCEKPYDENIIADIVNRRGKSKLEDYFLVPYLRAPEKYYINSHPDLFQNYNPDMSFVDYLFDIGKFDDFLDFYIKKTAISYCYYFDDFQIPYFSASDSQYIEIEKLLNEINAVFVDYNCDKRFIIKMIDSTIPYVINMTIRDGDLVLILPSHKKDMDLIKLLSSSFERVSNKMAVTLNSLVSLIRYKKPLPNQTNDTYFGQTKNIVSLSFIPGSMVANYLSEMQAIMVLDYLTVLVKYIHNIKQQVDSFESNDEYGVIFIDCQETDNGNSQKVEIKAPKDKMEICPDSFLHFSNDEINFPRISQAPIIDKTVQIASACIKRNEMPEIKRFTYVYESIIFDEDENRVINKIITTQPFSNCAEKDIATNICRHLVKCGVPKTIKTNNIFDYLLLQTVLKNYIEKEEIELRLEDEDLEAYIFVNDDVEFEGDTIEYYLS